MYVPSVEGAWISEKTARVAELISEYDHRLELRWIPEDRRQPGDAHFAIIEKSEDGREFVAFLIQDESFVDERLLARIYAADNAKGNVEASLEDHNKAYRAMQAKERQDQIDAMNDVALSMIKTPLHTYRHNGKKIDL